LAGGIGGPAERRAIVRDPDSTCVDTVVRYGPLLLNCQAAGHLERFKFVC
jgi:hypothetical protein